MKRARALSVRRKSTVGRSIRNTRTQALLTASAAALGGLALAAGHASAATLTWTGTTPDPTSQNNGGGGVYNAPTADFVHGATTPYRWSLTATNWSGGAYAQGSNVIFSNAGSGTTSITGNNAMNPASMTFQGGTSGTTYVFQNGSDWQYNNGTTNVNVGSNSPFGSGNTFSSQLVLDTGFQGTVYIRAGSTLMPTGATGLTIVRSGILELNAVNGLPTNGSSLNTPNILLAGGQLNVNRNGDGGGNTVPGTTQIAGTMTVSEDSILVNTSGFDSRVWGQGPLIIAAGKKLTIKSTQGFKAVLRANLNSALNTGTIQVADIGGGTTTNLVLEAGTTGTGNGGLNTTFDLGNSNSELSNNQGTATINLGALTSTSTTTKLSGSSAATYNTTYSIGARGDNTTFAGLIREGTGAVGTTNVAKAGAGTLTLTNANTYTGATTVNLGTLSFAGANGSVASTATQTVNTGGTLKLDNSAGNNNNRIPDGTQITMNGGNLVFVGDRVTPTAEAAGILRVGSGPSHVQGISSGVGGTATLTFSSLSRPGGGGTMDFSPAVGTDINFTTSPTLVNGIIGGYATANNTDWATVTGGSNTVTTYSGYTPAANGADPGTWGTGDNIDVTATGTLTVTGAANANSIKFTGAGGNIAVDSGQNLNVVSGGILLPPGVSTTIAGPGTISAGAAGSVAELFAQVPSAGSTLTLSTPIVNNPGGTVSLVKAGAGKLVLGSGNTYTGSTLLLEGTLVAGAANLFTGNLSINNGTTFDIGGFNQSLGSVTLINGALVNSGNPAAVVNATGNYGVQNGTVSAILAGTTALTKTTNGTVTLSAANTYSGGTNVNNGVLIAGVANNLGSGALVVNGSSTLDLQGFNQSVGAVTLGNSTQPGTILGTGVLTATSYSLENGTINPTLTGTGGLSKVGTNNTTVVVGASANTYTGVTTITGDGGPTPLTAPRGDLRITHLANGGQPSSIGQSTNVAGNLVLNGGVINYMGLGDSTDRLMTLTNNSAIRSGGSGPLLFTNAGTMVTSGGFALWLSGGNTGDNTFAPLITGNTALTKTDGGLWIVSNPLSDFTGVVTIQGSGTLVAPVLANGGSPSSIGASSNASTNMIFGASGSTGTLRYTGTGGSTDRSFFLNNTATIESSGSGPINWTNSGALNGLGTAGLVLGGTNTGNNIMAAAMPSSTVTSLSKTGSGTWTVTGALTYIGSSSAGTSVSDGRLILATNQTSQIDVNVSGGRLELGAGGGSTRIIKALTLEVTGTGLVDLQDNKMIIGTTPTGTWNGSAYTDLTGMVANGRNGSVAPLWDGSTGIVTSQTQATGGNLTSIGIAKASDVRPNTATETALWGGQTITGSDTLIMYTYGGDATLDGKINIDDYVKIDSGIAGAYTGWVNGDFNYDGKVSIDDYITVIDANIGNQSGVFPTGGGIGGGGLSGVSAVPEPASLAILGLGATALLGRRRRNRRA